MANFWDRKKDELCKFGIHVGWWKVGVNCEGKPVVQVVY